MGSGNRQGRRRGRGRGQVEVTGMQDLRQVVLAARDWVLANKQAILAACPPDTTQVGG